MKLNCAVIDDEFLARQYIIDYIKRIPFLNLAGDYNSPLLVLEEIKNNKIDILFLDIRMPDISGLDFLKILDPQPYIIFTTAYKEFAIDGYEHNVVDYLLKPFSFDRFLKAVNKVVNKINGERSVPAEVNGSGTSQKPDSENEYIVIKADRKLYKINFDDLVYIEGQKAYVTFHLKERKITALYSLTELERILPSERFIRIHKSFILSVKNMRALQGNQIEIGSVKLPVGSSYKQNVEKLFRLK